MWGLNVKSFIGPILIVIIRFGLYVTNPIRKFRGFVEENFRKEFNSDNSVLTSFLSSVTDS